MVDKLVLVRHGSPDYSLDVPDLRRPLTAAGLRSLEDALPRKLSLLEPVGRVQVWSSPALRARQTAQVVARCVHVDPDDVVECEALYTQDRESFDRQVREASGTLVIVGHVPFMERLFADLSGGSLPFGKGSAACFVFRGQDGPEPRLCWYVEGPDATRWESLLEMERQLSRAAKGLGDAYESLDERSRDPEELHAFRVSIRRARDLVAFLRPYVKHRQAEQLDLSLARLLHATSFLREVDTLCAHLEEVGDVADGEDALAGDGLALTAFARQVRDNERSRVMATLRRRNTQRILKEALHDLRSVRWRQAIEDTGLSREEVEAHYGKLVREVERRFDGLDVEDDDATHDLRKLAKSLRYVSEGFGPLLNDEERARGAWGRELQDSLGELCDARVNLQLVRTFRKRGGLSGARREVDSFVAGERRVEQGAKRHVISLQEARGQ